MNLKLTMGNIDEKAPKFRLVNKKYRITMKEKIEFLEDVTPMPYNLTTNLLDTVTC